MVALIHKLDDINQAVKNWQAQGQKVALVPTMGGLHEGHLALVRAARAAYQHVVVSIYVNPTQFAAGEDFDHYPRQLAQDCAAVATCGDNITIFAPDSLYEAGHATMITPQGAALPWEGVHRPHFFSGVATVVYRLFQAVPADIAYFGEKDYQQIAVIKQMVKDLSLPILIAAVPTIRADDGLALSSRNSYLSDEERALAPRLYGEMRRCAIALLEGKTPMDACQDACQDACASLQSQGFGEIDYFAWCDPITLAPQEMVSADSRLLVAVWLGQTRLIDNASYENLCNAQKLIM